MRVLIGCVSFLGLFTLIFAARAAEVETIAAAVPVEVAEVVNGGTWTDDSGSGFYRAIVVTPGSGAPASVVVQLLALENEKAAPKIAKTVLIKELKEHAFPNVYLAMDAETENEMTLIVTAYGTGTDQDTAIYFKFDGKGNYQLLDTPEEDPASTEETPKN